MQSGQGGRRAQGETPYFRPRQTWAFASAGVGLDVGRAFIRTKLDQPIASDGLVLIPISVGFPFRE